MDSKEITISSFELTESNGNLKALASNWSAVPNVTSAGMAKSKGDSVDRILDVADVTQQVSKAFSRMIDNTIGFLAAVGVSFEDADNSAAQNINTLSS